MKKWSSFAHAAALVCAILALASCSGSTEVADDPVTPTPAGTLTVTFDSQGGGTIPEAEILTGETVDEPVNLANATDEDLIFSGWYTEAACATRWDFDDPVTEDMTLYAKWNAADTLTFAAISAGAAWEVSKGTGSLDADLYIPTYYKGIPVTRIASYGFEDCSGITDLRLPEGLTALGYGSFWECTSLGAVEIPETVTSIEEYAFFSCNSLGGTIEISKNVVSIGQNAFWYCYPMTAINVDPDNANYSSSDGVLFDKSATTVIIYPCGKSNSSYSIPSTVTAIGDFAFNYNQHINTVTIPSSVGSIGYCAFINCYYFSYVFIPSNVTSIGGYAFASDWSLTIHCQAVSKPDGWSDIWASNTTSGAITWECSE